ncbi:MAG: hypothetical protein AB7V39_18300, partial [Nitrospiraceae bacterium]
APLPESGQLLDPVFPTLRQVQIADQRDLAPPGQHRRRLRNVEDARALLSAALTEHGLDGRRPFTLRRISTDDPRAFILQDGDY